MKLLFEGFFIQKYVIKEGNLDLYPFKNNVLKHLPFSKYYLNKLQIWHKKKTHTVNAEPR